jgi:hypothetical protein
MPSVFRREPFRARRVGRGAGDISSAGASAIFCIGAALPAGVVSV